MTSAIRILQRWLRPLERTPLHPQWLVLRHRRDIVTWVKDNAVGIFLDVGCGNGRLRDALPSSVRYVGIDYPATVALGYTGTADMLGDAAALPIADASVDVVALLDVLEHLPDPVLAVAEATRVLREGGRCLVHVPFLYPMHDAPYDHCRWTRHGLQVLLERQGLEIVDLHESQGDIESATAVLSIALAKGVVDVIAKRGVAMLLVPIMLVLIPLLNILGCVIGKFARSVGIMPFGYMVTLEKRCMAC